MSSQISRLAEAGLTRHGFIHGAGLAGAMTGLSKTLARADGMIGPHHVIATDSSLAFRALGTDRVAVVFGGDGSHATPHFHSALDNARLLDLPFICVLENNLYRQYAHYSYSSPHTDIADAARVVDPPDVFQVYNAAREAVDRARARADNGASFIEAKTYRYCKHWGAPGREVGKRGACRYDLLAITSFRPEREVRAWMQCDLVDVARKTLIDWGMLHATEAIEQEVRAEVAEAFAWAAEQPLCRPEDGLKHVFAAGEVLLRQIAWPQGDTMTVETWMYSVLEAVAAEMRADPAMIGIYELTPPVASNASMPVINAEAEFDRRRMVKTGLDENWMASAVLGTVLAGSRAATYIPYQEAGMPFQVVQNHVEKLHHMTGGKASMPVVFGMEMTGQTPGFAGQHSDDEIEPTYMNIPGVHTVIPSTSCDAKGMMASALRSPDPVAFLYPAGLRMLSDDLQDEQHEVPLDAAAVRQEGTDLTSAGSGGGMPEVLEAAKRPSDADMLVEVMDLPMLTKMDTDTLVNSVAKTRRLLAVGQTYSTRGPATEVVARCAENVEGARFRRIAFPDAPPPASPEMFNWMRPKADRIVDAAKRMV